MKIGKREVELKGMLLDLMKAHNKEHYHHNGIDITVVHEKEKVKVKVAGKDLGDEGDDDSEPDQE